MTLSDVASIFKCNGSICRVGIANSVVWERDPSGGPSVIILVSDGSIAPNPAVSKFFHAGFTPRRARTSEFDVVGLDPEEDFVPARPVRGVEIELLRDVLQRIVV